MSVILIIDQHFIVANEEIDIKSTKFDIRILFES